MRNENLILVIPYLEIEAEGVWRIGFACGRVINDIISCSVPSLTGFIASFFGVKENLHSLIIVGIVLAKVCDVESICSSYSCICEFEEEPLSVPLRVIVRPHM